MYTTALSDDEMGPSTLKAMVESFASGWVTMFSGPKVGMLIANKG